MIAGPDELGIQKDLIGKAHTLNLCSRIKFLGLVTGDDKEHLLRRCDVFALTSYSEGFSLAILEALAYGKPVVITEGCNFEDVGTYSAGFIKPPEPEAIASSLETILYDSALRKRMGENAVNLIKEKYTWDIVADKTLEFYNHVLEAKK